MPILTANDLTLLSRNPLAAQRKILEAITNVNGVETYFEDPSHPVPNIIEAAVVTSAGLIAQSDRNMRRLYPSLSTEWSDLYRHLSDSDYTNLFTTPSYVLGEGIYLMMLLEEIKSIAIEQADGSSLLTIPRHSEFMIGGLSFTLEFPIDIKLNAQGNLTITYDTSVSSNIDTLKTNKVEYALVDLDGANGLLLKVPMSQYAVSVKYMEVSASSKLSKTFLLDSKFYFCEAFMESPSGWTEILTTHSQDTYDVTKPTVAITISDGELTAKIPRVYQNTGLLTGRVKLRIYTTEGPMSRDLSTYSADDSQYRIGGMDHTPTVFTAPMIGLQRLTVLSSETTQGGRNAKTFDQVRELVVTRSIDDRSQPITSDQLTEAMSNLGYTIRPYVDNVTDRTFLLNRPLLPPTGLRFSSAINSRTSTFIFMMNELEGATGIKSNGNRLTITPDATFELQNDALRMIEPTDLANYTTTMDDNTLLELNNRALLFPAFHYVVDATDNLFRTRTYQLSTPTVESRVYLGSNSNMEMSIGVDQIDIALTDTGYSLVMTCTSDMLVDHLGDGVEIVAQVGVLPTTSNTRAYMNGTLVGTLDDQLTFHFPLACTYDIDDTDAMYLDSFRLFDTDVTKIPVALTSDFTISFAVTGFTTTGDITSEVDDYFNVGLVTAEDPVVLSAESFSIKLGSRVGSFWDAAVSYIGDSAYARYATDSLKYYTRNEYQVIDGSDQIFEYDEATQALTYNLVHAAGDPVLEDDVQVYNHRAGDIIYVDGLPTITDPGGVERQVDLFMLDGRFKFVSDTDVSNYVVGIPESIATWAEEEISEIEGMLLDGSKLKFYPTTTLGEIDVIVDNDKVERTSSEQTLTVTYYLSAVNYRDSDLQAYIQKVGRTVVADIFTQTTITRDGIEETLKEALGDNIKGLRVSGLGGSLDADVITLADKSTNFSLKKRLTKLSDGTITVSDAITTEWSKHQ